MRKQHVILPPDGRRQPNQIVRKPSPVAIAQEVFQGVEAVFDELNLASGVVSIDDGKKVLRGVTKRGKSLNVIVRDSGSGFREQTVSFCDVLTPVKRRAEAKRLRKEGMSQNAIAQRLGVSQKTISNDLAR